MLIGQCHIILCSDWSAVAGDERALDLFSSWRPKTGQRGRFGVDSSRENLNFFVGSSSGVIYYLNENGSCMEVLQADGAIRALLYHDIGDTLIVVTEALVVGQFKVEQDGSLVEVSTEYYWSNHYIHYILLR